MRCMYFRIIPLWQSTRTASNELPVLYWLHHVVCHCSEVRCQRSEIRGWNWCAIAYHLPNTDEITDVVPTHFAHNIIGMCYRAPYLTRGGKGAPEVFSADKLTHWSRKRPAVENFQIGYNLEWNSKSNINSQYRRVKPLLAQGNSPTENLMKIV